MNTIPATLSPSPRNLALTVHELEPGEFYWVLMEAVDDAAGEGAVHSYLPLEAAIEPHTSYSNALVAGVSVLRRLFGAEGPGRARDTRTPDEPARTRSR